MWNSYFPALDAIVFVVDATDLARIEEARDELTKLLQDDEVAHAPVLVLGNKIDKQNALSEDHLKHCLGISQVSFNGLGLQIRLFPMFYLVQVCTGKGPIPKSELSVRPVEVFMCSLMQRQGYGEGFQWLAQYLD